MTIYIKHCWFSEKSLGKEAQQLSRIEKASLVGEKIAALSLSHKIKEVVFDRSLYKYHGKVKPLPKVP